MPTKYTYLVIDLGAIAIPFIFSFHKKINFHRVWYAFWPANLIIGFIFLVWDILFTNAGVWGFNDRYILGIRVLGIPVEEILFFICIPYASVFTYACFRNFFPDTFKGCCSATTALLLALSLAGGLFNITRIYTGFTFILLSFVLILMRFIFKPGWLHTFYLMFLIILIPFFIVNGLLTGSYIEEPVVWYNDQENLGLRIFTIPVEDVFYGMLLLLLNIAAFERLKKESGSVSVFNKG